MNKKQIANFIITDDDNGITFHDVAGIWSMTIGMTSPQYASVKYIVDKTEDVLYETHLHNYITFNFLCAQTTIFDTKFAEDFSKAYTTNLNRNKNEK